MATTETTTITTSVNTRLTTAVVVEEEVMVVVPGEVVGPLMFEVVLLHLFPFKPFRFPAVFTFVFREGNSLGLPFVHLLHHDFFKAIPFL